MTTRDYNEMRRRQCREVVVEQFHLDLPIDEVLFDDIETGRDSYAVFFRSGRDMYALLIDENNTQTLGDARHTVRAMGLEAEKFLPPHADDRYFMRAGEKYFQQAFPGRKQWSTQEITHYQSYAVYSPALIRLSRINGEIKRFNTIGSAWQKAFEFSFAKVKVS